MREGKPVTVDVINDTDTPELVHWHGMLIPSDVDGAEEEGTPPVPPHGRRRYQLTPRPGRARWYHSHAMAVDDLHRAPTPASSASSTSMAATTRATTTRSSSSRCATGSRSSPAAWTTMTTTPIAGPQPEKPAALNTDPNGLEVDSMTYSINDKALGAGEPIRVSRASGC